MAANADVQIDNEGKLSHGSIAGNAGPEALGSVDALAKVR